jgi:O-antigen biosynthesis protein WbqV
MPTILGPADILMPPASSPPTSNAAAPALPTTGVVLIGTLASARAMAMQAAALDRPPIIVGVVLDAPGTLASPDPALPPILGVIDDLPALHARHRFRLALVSLGSSLADRVRLVSRHLSTLALEARWVPTLEDVLSGAGVTHVSPTATAASPARAPTVTPGPRLSAPAIDPVALIGRSHYEMDEPAVRRIIQGKRVLITGAGGSIGSELARVCAALNPERLLLMERSENALFQIDHEMARRFPGVARSSLLHDVVDADQTLRLCLEHRPQVVIHAAAHKHVPLMEDHPAHAVSNNLFGTRSIADAAGAAGAERFVMISSDKAVNPTSVMGATKRLAELYVSSLAQSGHARSSGDDSGGSTLYSMVRFGNVLASAGSVIPVWSQQLAEGVPITVTDPRMTRYFMTIPEAATLVMSAAALHADAGSAPVFVLNMGQPLRIVDLAARFARLHGVLVRIDSQSIPAAARDALAATPLPESDPLSPDQARALAMGMSPLELGIATIVFTGARPGEKLYEELGYGAEQLAATAHPGVTVWTAPTARADRTSAMRMIAELSGVRSPSADKASVLSLIRRHVPEMATPPRDVAAK